MKLLLIISFYLLTISSGNAFSVTSDWNPFFVKEVAINCSEGDYFCQDYCGKKSQCLIEEEFCRNCVGSDLYLTYIFNHVGKTIVRAEEEISEYEFIDFINKGMFSTISAKSVYNHVERFNGDLIKGKFQKLCSPYNDEYPIIFYNIEEVSFLLEKPEFLVCNDSTTGIKIFKMGTPADGALLNQ